MRKLYLHKGREDLVTGCNLFVLLLDRWLWCHSSKWFMKHKNLIIMSSKIYCMHQQGIQYWRIKYVVTFSEPFLDSRNGLSNFRFCLSCSHGSQNSKLVLHFSVALFLFILWPFQWSQLTNGNIPKSSENHILYKGDS